MLLTADEYSKMILEKSPEYQIARKNVEKEKAQVKNARNQLLPQLNLVGSLYTTSMSSYKSKMFTDVTNDNFLSWSVGLTLKVPLLTSMQGRSALAIAEMRLRQAENELNSIVRGLNNAMSTKVEELRSAQGQLIEHERGLKAREELLEVERIKFRQGRTNLKSLFNKEEEYMNYLRRVLSTVVNHKVSEASLEIATGNILTKYEIDKQTISGNTAGLSGSLREILEQREN